ncbi:L-dopachrome tautomerase-related protein [Rhizosphaericola mali]|uniref:Gluconolactonase n=1 Tax=Rhizosphaericola mali TaxID=2545455 RepID=A0A5P2G2T7_9BACT|nr:L-dopachrome tautomerase-related protein [Rhizosphaericola mali]QES88132.1 hypothetical protein E0W69_005455 [Rhizosphaericola mali]
MRKKIIYNSKTALFSLIFGMVFLTTIQAQTDPPKLNLIAETYKNNWNGVAISNDGRLFAEFPRFDKGDYPSIVEIKKDGSQVPYPNKEWNSWKKGNDPLKAFVSLNAIYINKEDNHLWAVDPGDPNFGANIKGAEKLVEMDVNTNKVIQTYIVPTEMVPGNTHFNDIRIKGDWVYITESTQGSIFVLNKKTKKFRRLLLDSKLTKADTSIHPEYFGRILEASPGKAPVLNADQVELNPAGDTLYFSSPFGPNLYQVATADLRNETLTTPELEKRISVYITMNPIGGLIMDKKGNLYLGEVKNGSIRCVGQDKKTKWILQDDRIKWPDALSISEDGTFYIAIAQVGSLPMMSNGKDLRNPPFYIFSFKPKE